MIDLILAWKDFVRYTGSTNLKRQGCFDLQRKLCFFELVSLVVSLQE